jgi:hypothetical protein
LDADLMINDREVPMAGQNWNAAIARRWNAYQPTNIRDALKGCKDYAKDRHNRSVQQIADRIGLTDQWVVYKWVQTGRIPAPMIAPFEAACGINLVSRWLAASTGRMLIEIPSGRNADANDIQTLQQQLHAVTGLLIEFYAGSAEAEDTLAGVQTAMQALAWHRGNVQQHGQPQLEF